MIGGWFSELLTVLLIVFVIVTIAVECWKVYLNNTKLNAFCYSKKWPVLGHAWQIIGKNNEEIMKTFGADSEKLRYIWVGPVLVVHVCTPQHFQALFSSDKFLKKAFIYSFMFNKTGLFTAEPGVWKEHRRALNPTLGPKMVSTFVPTFNEKSAKMADLMGNDVGSFVDIHRYMFRASIDSVLASSFGLDWSLQNQHGDYIHDIILDAMHELQLRVQRVWLWSPIFVMTKQYTDLISKFNIFYRFNRSALEVKKMQLAEKMNHGVDELAIAKDNNNMNFLQKCLHLEREMKFDNVNVDEEMDTIVIASADTSATTMNGIVLMLAIHQEYQDRVVDELHEIFEDPFEPVTNEHLSRMTFLEIVMKESLRHFPVSPLIARESTDDFAIDGGVIPKGSTIIFDIYKTNRDPKFWGDNALEFYPERFLPENCADWHPYLFMPFGAGARNCIGARYAWTAMKIALAHMLRRYKFTSELKMHQVKVVLELLLKIDDKNAIRIERRQW